MKEFRFAVAGFGNIAKTHITALRAMPVIKKLPFNPVLDTLVTRRSEELAGQARAIGFRTVTKEISDAARDSQIDIVDICTPNANHYEEALAALQGGKAIYCEKPVTDTYERSARLLEALQASSNPVPEQLAFTFRYHPAVIRIRHWLQSGAIGDVLQCKISYRRAGYLSAERPVTWRLDSKSSGGGAISDLGVHVLDLIRHWFGELNNVTGTTETHVKQRKAADGQSLVEVDVDDWALMQFNTVSGVKGIAEVSRIALGSAAYDIQIVGTKGSITCDLERDLAPAVHLLKGPVPVAAAPAELELLPDEKTTMGIAVDTHFGALHHFLWRLYGEDRYPGLAPTIADGVKAEYWIDRIIEDSRR